MQIVLRSCSVYNLNGLVLMAMMLSMRLAQLTENELKLGDQWIFIQLHSTELNQVVKYTIQLQILTSSPELFNLIHHIIFFTT